MSAVLSKKNRLKYWNVDIYKEYECLLISSLPGKTLRTLVESRGLASGSTCVLKDEPGKLDIKRRKPGILFISLPIGSIYKLAIITFDYRFFCVDSASMATSFKKCNVILT